MINKNNKKAQEEMIGFALIIIIVAVIILVMLGIALNKPSVSKGVESYEINSFIQALLQYTTTCSTDYWGSYDDLGDLISQCDAEQTCANERDACEVLNSTLSQIISESWKVGEDRPVKGYLLNITLKGDEILSLKDGNLSSNYKGGLQTLPKRESSYDVEFRVYY